AETHDSAPLAVQLILDGDAIAVGAQAQEGQEDQLLEFTEVCGHWGSFSRQGQRYRRKGAEKGCKGAEAQCGGGPQFGGAPAVSVGSSPPPPKRFQCSALSCCSCCSSPPRASRPVPSRGSPSCRPSRPSSPASCSSFARKPTTHRAAPSRAFASCGFPADSPLRAPSIRRVCSGPGIPGKRSSTPWPWWLERVPAAR